MALVYYPSCKVKATFPKSSRKVGEYLKERFGIDPAGCCRVDRKLLAPEDTAIVICNNCGAILEESSEAGEVEFLWQVIDADPDFTFPDYRGERITIQDCWIARERRAVQEAVRSLLHKMNFEVAELPGNFEKADFCGVNLLKPPFPGNVELAPRKYTGENAKAFHPMSEEEQDAYLKKHCEQITTDRVACYCKFCKEGIERGGRQAVHMVELLFPTR